MKEEDNIDARIERVVRSVAAKKADMDQWKTIQIPLALDKAPQKSRNIWRIAGASVAAVALLVAGVGIGIGYMNRDREDAYVSHQVVYRSGGNGLAGLGALPGEDDGEPKTALQEIDEALADTFVDPSYSPERQEYLRELNRVNTYLLTWLKIKELIKENRKEEAFELLESYKEEEGEHREEAARLYKKLKR